MPVFKHFAVRARRLGVTLAMTAALGGCGGVTGAVEGFGNALTGFIVNLFECAFAGCTASSKVAVGELAPRYVVASDGAAVVVRAEFVSAVAGFSRSVELDTDSLTVQEATGSEPAGFEREKNHSAASWSVSLAQISAQRAYRIEFTRRTGEVYPSSVTVPQAFTVSGSPNTLELKPGSPVQSFTVNLPSTQPLLGYVETSGCVTPQSPARLGKIARIAEFGAPIATAAGLSAYQVSAAAVAKLFASGDPTTTTAPVRYCNGVGNFVFVRQSLGTAAPQFKASGSPTAEVFGQYEVRIPFVFSGA